MQHSRYNGTPALSPIKKKTPNNSHDSPTSMTNLLTPNKYNHSFLSSTRMTPTRVAPKYSLSKTPEVTTPKVKSPLTPRFNSHGSIFYSPTRVNTSAVPEANLMQTHQAKYGRPGLFPVVHIFPKRIPLITPKQNSCVVKLASSSSVLFSDTADNSFESQTMQPVQTTDSSTRSVLDALKEISRKRIHDSDSFEIKSKRWMESKEVKLSSEYAKRNRDDDATTSPKSTSTSPQQATKRICVVDPVYASNTSSFCLKNNKRKLYECWTPTNEQKAKKLMSVETQTVIEPVKKTVEAIVEVRNTSEMAKASGKEKDADVVKSAEIPEEDAQQSLQSTNQQQRLRDEKIYSIQKKNKLAIILSRMTGEKPQLIPVPKMWDQGNDVTDSTKEVVVTSAPIVVADTINSIKESQSTTVTTTTMETIVTTPQKECGIASFAASNTNTETTASILSPISSTSSTPPNFNFGSNSIAKSSSAIATSVVAPTITFSAVTPATTPTTSSSVISSGFTLSKENTTSAVPTTSPSSNGVAGGFKFDRAPEKSFKIPGEITFGSPKSSSLPAAVTNAPPAFSMPSSTTITTPSTTVAAPTAAAAAATFNFQNNTSFGQNPPATTSSFGFGSIATPATGSPVNLNNGTDKPSFAALMFDSKTNTSTTNSFATLMITTPASLVSNTPPKTANPPSFAASVTSSASPFGNLNKTSSASLFGTSTAPAISNAVPIPSTTSASVAGGFAFKSPGLPSGSIFGSTNAQASNANSGSIFGNTAATAPTTTSSVFDAKPTTTVAPPPSLFGGFSAASSTPAASTTSAPPAFAAYAPVVKSNPPPPAFGVSTTASVPTCASSGFSSGGDTTSALGGGFGAGFGNTGNAVTTPKPGGFSFSPANNTFGAATTNPPPAFGSTTTSASGFGAVTAKPPAFGIPTTTVSAFGTPTITTTSSLFGGAGIAAAQSTSALFGTTTTTSSGFGGNASNNASVFGGFAGSPAGSTSTGFGGTGAPPAFGATNNNPPPAFGAPTGNTFGNTATTTPNPGFGFGSTAPATATATMGFGDVGAGRGTSGGFSFNPANPAPTTTAAPPSFGAGGNNSTMFSFGSNASAPAAKTTSAFSFGSAATTTPAFGGNTGGGGFGATTNTTFGAANNNPPQPAGFGGGSAPNVNPFGAAKSITPTFGTVAPTFGAGSSNASTPAFGSTAPVATGFGQAQPTGSLFGGANNNGSMFGGGSNINANGSFSGAAAMGGNSSFTFKAPTATDAPSKPIFSFGAAEAPKATPGGSNSGAFNFSAAASPQAQFGGGAFGASSPQQQQQPGMFSIGAGPSTSLGSKRQQLRAKRRT